MRSIVLLQVFSLLLFLSSCAGYQIRDSYNPFKDYGISSITVPMFFNKSIETDFTPSLTREFILMLNKYPGLKIYSGDNSDADAVLIGVLYSSKYKNRVYNTSQVRVTDGQLKQSIGQRDDFTVPYKISYNFNLVLYLIKRPNNEDLELLKQDLPSDVISKHPKVIISQTIPISSKIARVNYPNLSPDDGGSVNQVQNRAILKKSLDDYAYTVATQFKELVINAF